jgi:hypothetical protein
MPALPTTTPQRTLPIKSFVVYLQDGRTIQVVTDAGEGFFRQQTIVGKEKTIKTYECFIVNGRWKLLTVFGNGGETMSDEPTELSDEDDSDELTSDDDDSNEMTSDE